GFWALLPILSFSIFITLALLNPQQMHVLFWLAIASYAGVWLAQVIQAGYFTRSSRVFTPGWYNKIIVYAGFYLLSAVATGQIGRFVRANVAENVGIYTASMTPSLLRGDFVLVAKPKVISGVRYGDVVMRRSSDSDLLGDPRRVIAMPGDELTIRGMRVTI